MANKKAVLDGVINYTSVSQIKKFSPKEEGGCPRRWYFNYVMCLPESGTFATDTGAKVHAQLEHYLETGEDVLGPIARTGLEFLPTPGADLLIEVAIDGECTTCGGTHPASRRPNQCRCEDYAWPETALRASGVPLVGKIDLVNVREGVEVLDHKTSSNVRAYAKGPDAIANDPQMVGYAEWARSIYPSAEEIRVTHITYPTDTTPKKKATSENRPDLQVSTTGAAKSTTLVPLKLIRDRWQSVSSIVEQMQSAAGEAEYKKVPKNELSCRSYGRPCPYLSQCNDRVPLSALGKSNGVAMSLLNKLKRPAAPAEIPAIPPPAAQTVRGPEYSTQQQETFKVDANGVPVKKLLIEEVPAILAPDAPKSDPELAAECAPCADAGSAGKQHKIAECPVVNPPAEAPKRGRGRPKTKVSEGSPAGISGGAENTVPVTAGTAQVVPQTVREPTGDVPAASKAGVAKSDAPPEAAKGSTFDLYVDAIPSVPYTTLDAYVARLHTAIIIEGAGQPDMALVDYGKGKGLMRAAAAAEPPAPGVYVIFSSDLAAPVIEALAPLARVVTRGVR